jgi:hypothetical protein
MIFVPVYLIEEHNTYMNSLLFNSLLLLLCSLPCVHFIIQIFQEYFNWSWNQILYGVYLENLPFFGWFYRNNIFYYLIFIWCLGTIFYLIFRKNKTRLNLEEMFEQRKKLEAKLSKDKK